LIVQANPFGRMWDECRADYSEAVSRVGESGWYILGNEVSAFEDALAKYCGASYAVGCANGMDAIEIALRVLGIGMGDKVLTTPLSAFATALAIVRAGAEPIFCDVDENGTIDPDCVTEALNEHPDIRVIIPVHLYGHLADIARLSEIADANGISIIEDAAQAIGATRGAERVGGRGHMACFSFYPTKNLGVIGDGGALIVSTSEQADVAKQIRNYGQTERYVHDVVGLNSRLDELHAATLNSALLPRLDGWLARRREIAARYLGGINNDKVTCVKGPDDKGSSWHLFATRVSPSRRDEFLNHLTEAGIQAGLHYPVLLSDQKALIDHQPPIVVGDLINARKFANGEVSLPINPHLTDAEVEHVIKTVNGWAG